MPTGADIITAVDTAAVPLLAMLEANGPTFVNGPGGVVYVYYRDGKSANGYSIITAKPASAVNVNPANQTATAAKIVAQKAQEAIVQAAEGI